MQMFEAYSQNFQVALSKTYMIFSKKLVFWKYVANLQENTHAEVWFQWSCFATLLKLHFGVGVHL